MLEKWVKKPQLCTKIQVSHLLKWNLDNGFICRPCHGTMVCYLLLVARFNGLHTNIEEMHNEISTLCGCSVGVKDKDTRQSNQVHWMLIFSPSTIAVVLDHVMGMHLS